MGRAPKGVPLGHSKLLRRYSSDLSHKPKVGALWDKGTGLAGFTPGFMGNEARLGAKLVLLSGFLFPISNFGHTIRSQASNFQFHSQILFSQQS